MTPFVSVHQIIKENTNLAVRMLEANFTSLEESYFPNELIIVDNGSFEPIFDLYNTWKPRFKAFDCEMKVIKSDLGDYSSLRNLCLEHTNNNADFWFWSDGDECVFPEDLDRLKNHEMQEVTDIRQIWSCFYHAMIVPWQIQINTDCLFKKKKMVVTDVKNSKDNIFPFKKNSKVRWIKEQKVHEHVDQNTLSGKVVVTSSMEYMHAGYVKKQVETFVKWLRYALLEFGSIDCYKKETVTYDKDGVEVGNQFMGQEGYTSKVVDYLRSWRDPFHIIHDRREHCIPFFNDLSIKDHYPSGYITMMGGCKTEEDWLKYLDKLDPPKFELEWLDKFKEKGNYCDTLDWAVAELQKRNWNIYK